MYGCENVQKKGAVRAALLLSVLELLEGWGLNPLACLNDPLALVNLNPFGGCCNPLLISFTVNEWFASTSTVNHHAFCIPCVWSFEHLLVI